MIEIWKDIPDFEGIYQARNLGRIRSLSRKEFSKRNFSINGRILTHDVSAVYHRVIFFNNIKYLVHRLVALAFLPNHNNLPQVNHINGNKNDNRLENLEWCTMSHNMKHSYEKLNRKPSITSLLSKDDVLFIRDLSKDGFEAKQIHNMYFYDKVKYHTVSDAASFRRWKHV